MIPTEAVRHMRAVRVGHGDRDFDDVVAVEQPLEMRLRTRAGVRTVAVTMRTPGHDDELAVGYLFADGIIADAAAVRDVDVHGHRVDVTVAPDAVVDLSRVDRQAVMHGGCGVCGKKSIAAVHVKQRYAIALDGPVVRREAVHAAMDALRRQQPLFAATGGTHASALADTHGTLLAVREDVGRHNALDKLIGAQVLAGALPLRDRLLLVSGRASFELVQKAAVAGLGLLCAVGAPSSLAVELAQDRGMTLIGFVRDGRFNIYSGVHRIR